MTNVPIKTKLLDNTPFSGGGCFTDSEGSPLTWEPTPLPRQPSVSVDGAAAPKCQCKAHEHAGQQSDTQVTETQASSLSGQGLSGHQTVEL